MTRGLAAVAIVPTAAIPWDCGTTKLDTKR